MNEHELKLHCMLFGCPSVIVLCVYAAAHACSFNYKSDYTTLQPNLSQEPHFHSISKMVKLIAAIGIYYIILHRNCSLQVGLTPFMGWICFVIITIMIMIMIIIQFSESCLTQFPLQIQTYRTLICWWEGTIIFKAAIFTLISSVNKLCGSRIDEKTQQFFSS